MKLIEKDSYYELKLSEKELEYSLEILLKTNTNLPLDDIKKISGKTTKKLSE